MISSKDKTSTHAQRHGIKDVASMQVTVEKMMNLQIILNLLKQSKTVLSHFQKEFGIIKDSVLDLEYQVQSKINDLRVEMGL